MSFFASRAVYGIYGGSGSLCYPPRIERYPLMCLTEIRTKTTNYKQIQNGKFNYFVLEGNLGPLSCPIFLIPDWGMSILA
jgi:hypothetical protein